MRFLMTGDAYVRSIIGRYRVSVGVGSLAYRSAIMLFPIIRRWANKYLRKISFSGSYAKGTAISGRTDVDIFVSLKSTTQESLQEVFDSLYQCMLDAKYYSARKQNVSIHINRAGVEIDIVPGIHFAGNTEDHWLYVKKSGQERVKTNIIRHINYVRNSHRISEIKAIKIWSKLHGLDFPSFYLELAVVSALRGKIIGRLSENVWAALHYLATEFVNKCFVDPSNTNNIISDELTAAEKKAIASQAASSYQESNWGNIIW